MRLARSASRRTRRSGHGLAFRVEWHSGPRTPAWDALWRLIFADIASESGASGEGAPMTKDDRERGIGEAGDPT